MLGVLKHPIPYPLLDIRRVSLYTRLMYCCVKVSTTVSRMS